MSKKLMALLLAAMMLLSLAAACGNDKPVETPTTPAPTTPTPTTPAPTEPAPAEPKIYYTYQTADIDTLNGAATSYSNNETAINYCNSSLYLAVPDEDGMGFHFIPDLAAEMPKQIDELTWEVALRKEAKWHNGDPINADTWMFTFQEILNPKLVNQLASFFYAQNITILNGENYAMQGSEGYPATVAWEEVGIKKIDDYTLQFTTVDPVTEQDFCTHFTHRSNYPYHPETYQACMSDDGLTNTYGIDLDHWMGCGPYTFDTWEYDNIHIYKKVEDHWLADIHHFDEIHNRIIPEENARVQLFESGQLDHLSPSAEVREKYLDDPRMVTYPSLYVYDYDLNTRNPNNPLSGNNNYEKALYHAMNREVMAKQIFGGMEPAGWYINGQAGSLSESGLCYRDSKYGNEVEDLVNSWSAEGEVCGYNPELAYDYLMKAYADCNLPEDTVITLKSLHTETSVNGGKLCELIIEEFSHIFKGKIVVECSPCASGMTLSLMSSDLTCWDFTFQDWGRSLSRKLPYEVYQYHRESYTGRPTHTYTDAFEAAFQACEAVKNEDYETILQASQKLELQALEDVISIPVVQGVNFVLYSDRIELPMKQYVNGFGWGARFADIAE